MVVQSKRTEVNSATVAYTIATWDDETGDGELVEFDLQGRRSRRWVLTHWPNEGTAKPGDVIGESVWSDSEGIELRRKPILEP